MKGGYQILDLRNIGISYSSETKNITDPEILNQLRNLREYIEKGHNYSSALNNSLKCVMIRYRDAKVSEKWEECEFATINSSNASLTYEIKGKELRIEVVFEEKQDDDGNPYYDIKTAKYLYNQNVTIGGDLIVGGDATFQGKINGESNPSLKPIYVHPINISGVISDGLFDISLLIFDNNASAYTWDTFKTWLETLSQEIGNVRIATTGSVTKENVMMPANYFLYGPNSKLLVVRPTTEGVDPINLNIATFIQSGAPRYFQDGVNKIN